LAIALTLLSVGACHKSTDKQVADNQARDLELAPADTTSAINDAPAPQAAPAPAATPAPKPTTPKPQPAAAAPAPKPQPKPVAPATVSLGAGSRVTTAAVDTISSRHQKAGESFQASVGEDIKNDKGQVVIPAGSLVTFQIVTLEPAENKSQKDGKLELKATEVSIHGQTHPIDATVTSVTHFLKGRGVTGGDAAKVGGATAGGAVIGGLLGKGKGAVIGGLIGAGAGTAAAVHSADRDVVIPAGGEIVIALLSPLTIPK
jgi:hypothetical protein